MRVAQHLLPHWKHALARARWFCEIFNHNYCSKCSRNGGGALTNDRASLVKFGRRKDDNGANDVQRNTSIV